MIEIKNIYKIYNMGKINVRALDGVNFKVSEGEYVSIMGASGSGKSTMMNILGCLDRPSAGKYLLNDKEVQKLSDNSLAVIRNKQIGFVFQTFNLLPRTTAVENVELPLVYAGMLLGRRKRAVEALTRVGLGDRVFHKPSELSGGQQQRVAIARALVNDPTLLLADEPTGNLDTKSSIEIMKVFQALNDSGVTIVMVTHEDDISKHTKRVIRLRDGKIEYDKSVENRTTYSDAKVLLSKA